MKTLDTQAYEEVRRWMHRNARPLELARWRYHFEKGAKRDVLRALSAYQNTDGGFGHALEADNWNPNSSPYETGSALEVFRELGMFNPRNPVIEKAFDYLNQYEVFPGQGWPFTVPSNNDHPHAPWWGYSGKHNEANGYHASGGIVGYILRCGDTGSSLYQRALALADGMVDKLRRDQTLEVHEVGAYCTLLRDIQAAGLTERFDTDYVAGRLRVMVNDSIERDPTKWPRYSMRPSMYITAPDSPYYPGNESAVAQEMDYILSSRQPGGVWDISWTWEDYPKQFAVAERWWQGDWAIRNLRLLRDFGRFPSAVARDHTVKENVAVYYSKDMDKTLAWFMDTLGWDGRIIDRDENGCGTYGFVSDAPQEPVASQSVPFCGFHLWAGEPLERTVALIQVGSVDALFSRVKQNGYTQISDIHATGASPKTCVVTTPDGSDLWFFE